MINKNYSNHFNLIKYPFNNIGILVFFVLVSTKLFSQSANDFQLFEQNLQVTTPKTVVQSFQEQFRHNNSTLDKLASGLFYVYKSFFSSQDVNMCNFHPSCSVYGIEAVKKYGAVKGGIMTMDRLTRCNGFSPEKYTIDLKFQRFSDPIQ